MKQPVPVERADRLGPAEIADVLALATAAGDADGAFPFSEHVVLHLRYGGDGPAVHLLIRKPGGELVGYAHVDPTDEVDGASAELCVHPAHRRHGLGRALIEGVIAAAEENDPRGRLRLWAHGDHPSAGALALSLGFDRARVLFQLRRSLYAPVDAPRLPDGVTLRPFRAGDDDEAWLALNKKAFADHPEQGRWTAADLEHRLAEPWFDPAGFLIAERSAGLAGFAGEGGVDRADFVDTVDSTDLVGFHWTKVHGRSSDVDGDHDHDPIGEVYVLGVDPAAHGLGLGAALTLAGLRHLRSRGLDQVMLYVDEDNTAATKLYQRLGFARWSTDVCYRRPARAL